MLKLESAKRFWLNSIPGLLLIGLILGGLISIPVIHEPKIATIEISGSILEQSYVDDILDMLNDAKDDHSIRGIVLLIDTPGGEVSLIEQIYLDVLRLRQHKPVVASVGAKGLSGGYFIAVASNFIYAEPNSQLGSIGVWVGLPTPEELDEEVVTTGPFKATGSSRRKAVGQLEMVRQEFIEVVVSQRGDKLNLSEEELSRAEIHSGIESLRYGLIDDIGTRTAAIEKAASLSRVRNYEVVELNMEEPENYSFGPSELEALKAKIGLIPTYYYLYFEAE